MKVCFAGMGSIGKRHLFNFVELCKERAIDFQIDLLRETDSPISNQIKSIIKNEYFMFDEMDKDYEIAFITNPTSLHYDSILKFGSISKNMFIEKPLFHNVSLQFPEQVFNKGGTYHVAAPLRFSPVIEYLKKDLLLNQIFSVRAVCSSYLPDWRPGVDYRETYSANREMGGGVRLDLIHEWDYIRYIFGDPSEVLMLGGKFSKLEINAEDLFVYIAKYKDKIIEIHLDYFGRKEERKIKLYKEDEAILADLKENTIEFEKAGKIVRLKKEDIYKKEMRYFMDLVFRGEKSFNPPEYAFETIKFALGGIK